MQVNSRHLFLLQNALAAVVFFVAVAGNAAAYLLHEFPQSQTLWRLSIPLNRAAAGFTEAIDQIATPNPILSFVLIVPAILLPTLAWKRQSLLATAGLGHLALALTVLMTMNVADLRLRQAATADLFDINPDYVGGRVFGLGLIAAVMLVLCTINHLAYLRASRD